MRRFIKGDGKRVIRHGLLGTALYVLVCGSPSLATDVATGTGDQSDVAESPPVGYIGSDIAQSLFGPGTIPNADGKLRSQTYQCRSFWNSLKSLAKKTSEKPVQANLCTIVANAKKAGADVEQLDKTLATYLANQKEIPNQRYITFVDFNKRSNQNRMYIVDLEKGTVQSYQTSAGENSDPRRSGYATRFSNTARYESSLGCYLTHAYPHGKHGPETNMLMGFQSSNDDSCNRDLEVHHDQLGRKAYVGTIPGRSDGCLAVKNGDIKTVYNETGDGLICSYYGKSTNSLPPEIAACSGAKPQPQEAAPNEAAPKESAKPAAKQAYGKADNYDVVCAGGKLNVRNSRLRLSYRMPDHERLTVISKARKRLRVDGKLETFVEVRFAPSRKTGWVAEEYVKSKGDCQE